jgi:hypothetical protein
MITIQGNESFRDCDGVSRRSMLKVGSLGLSAFGLPAILQSKEFGAKPNKSVVWLWLGGGATHVETFDPKPSAPAEFRSVVGAIDTNVPGIQLGGLFERLSKVTDKLAVVRSFAHRNSGHGGGTHWLMTGYDNRQIDNGGLPHRPSIGSIVTRTTGTNNAENGMPRYIRLGGISADGPAFLGPAYAPFDPSGEAKKNLQLKIQMGRLNNRRDLLKRLDNYKREVDRTGLMEGLDKFEKQAFDTILGNSTKAFDLKLEDPKIKESYGPGLGDQLLLARRLCEAGSGFVTVHYGGWDMHSTIEKSLKGRVPQLDRAVAAFIDDVHQRGLQDDILLVITGEFGRTPRINKNAGRDHWAPLSTLALSGGGMNMGQIIGKSSKNAEIPSTKPVRPQDLMATIFKHFNIDENLQYIDKGGRPVYMIEDGTPIPELG